MAVRNLEMLRSILAMDTQAVAVLDTIWTDLTSTQDPAKLRAALIAASTECPSLEEENPALEWETPLSVLRAIAEQYWREKNASN